MNEIDGNTPARGRASLLLKSLVADAVAVEPISTAEFPANREKNREFFNFGQFAAPMGS